jgi:hypothetical protein
MFKDGSSTIDPVSKNYVYSLAPNEFGIDMMNVYVDQFTGEILTSFPVSGSNVVKVW